MLNFLSIFQPWLSLGNLYRVDFPNMPSEKLVSVNADRNLSCSHVRALSWVFCEGGLGVNV